jgi:prefoldin subunit 5
MVATSAFAQQQQVEVPYTLADRDRLIQVEAEIKAIRNEMNSLRNEMNSLRNEMNSIRNEQETKFDAINRRIDDLRTLFFWGFGLLFSMMIFMLGFIIWDRRTTLAPVKSDIEKLKKENEMLKEIFKKHSESHPQ